MAERHTACGTTVRPLTSAEVIELEREQARAGQRQSSEGFVYCPRCLVFTAYSTEVREPA